MKRKLIITFIVIASVMFLILALRYYKLFSHTSIDPAPCLSESIEMYKNMKDDSIINGDKFAHFIGADFVYNANVSSNNYNLFIIKNRGKRIVHFHDSVEYSYVKVDSVSLNDGRKILFKEFFQLHDFVNSSIIDDKTKKAYIESIGNCYTINSKKDSLFLFFIPNEDCNKILLIRNGKENCYILQR